MRSFFDTNVLVYAFDHAQPRKRQLARELPEREIEQGRALLITQVLQEFFVVVTRRLSPPLTHESVSG